MLGNLSDDLGYNLGLKDLKLKKWYDSDIDDILHDFYIPSLSEAIRYRRLAGFFSSASLAVAAKGICQLIANKGKYELVACPRFHESDVEAIKKAYESPESLIERKFLDELDEMTERFIEDHVRAFGWMLANNLLTIKVAIVCTEEGLPMDEVAIKRKGLFHHKVGILEDIEGNKISYNRLRTSLLAPNRPEFYYHYACERPY